MEAPGTRSPAPRYAVELVEWTAFLILALRNVIAMLLAQPPSKMTASDTFWLRAFSVRKQNATTSSAPAKSAV